MFTYSGDFTKYEKTIISIVVSEVLRQNVLGRSNTCLYKQHFFSKIDNFSIKKFSVAFVCSNS